MNIAANTDFLRGTGSAEPYLKLLAENGFTHIHWCHQWHTDYLYSKYEFQEFRKWFKKYGLTLLDVHGTAGMEKSWFSLEEYQRKSGVELVINRIQMMSEMEGQGGLIMHPPRIKTGMTEEEKQDIRRKLESVQRSLDELMPVLEKYGQRIALENLPMDDYAALPGFLNRYPAKLLGITYDSGHGNMDTCKGLDFIEAHKDRIAVLHLHDNDGSGDQHQPPFMGTVDWERLAKILATSSYKGPMSFEISMKNTPYYEAELKADQKMENIQKFLADAYERCMKFSKMVEACR